MSSPNQSGEKFHQRLAWLIPFVLALLMVLFGLYIFAVPHPDQGDLDTYFGGREWATFVALQPDVAGFVSMSLRLVGVGYLSFSLFAMLIAVTGFRKGERWTWYVLWVLPLAFALTAVAFYLDGARPELGTSYVVAAAIAVLGLILPIRRFFPRSAG